MVQIRMLSIMRRIMLTTQILTHNIIITTLLPPTITHPRTIVCINRKTMATSPTILSTPQSPFMALEVLMVCSTITPSIISRFAFKPDG
mmetsp:Transcript_24200/g.38015  ORF Transcript_24200/g.38015 Transcript_24200/m.38015 type:complete len:89 (+) Transcript_24200:616-882(+)